MEGRSSCARKAPRGRGAESSCWAGVPPTVRALADASSRLLVGRDGGRARERALGGHGQRTHALRLTGWSAVRRHATVSIVSLSRLRKRGEARFARDASGADAMPEKRTVDRAREDL